MSFAASFTKTAFLSPYSKERVVKSTPVDKGGHDGKGHYIQRYHPEIKRWSCTCPDFIARRGFLGEEHSDKHDCKHIIAIKKKKKFWEVQSVPVRNKFKEELKEKWLSDQLAEFQQKQLEKARTQK